MFSGTCIGFTWGSASAGWGKMLQPCMFFIPDKGSPGHPFIVLPVMAPSCASVFSHECMPYLLRTSLLAPFFDRKSCFSVKMKMTFWRNGSWKDKWKESSANKRVPHMAPGAFLILTCWTLSHCCCFAMLEKAANAALVFFPQTCLDLISIQCVVQWGRFTPVKLWAWGRCA